jgi:hypothetical protein
MEVSMRTGQSVLRWFAVATAAALVLTTRAMAQTPAQPQGAPQVPPKVADPLKATPPMALDECSAGNNTARLNGKSINEAMRAG